MCSVWALENLCKVFAQMLENAFSDVGLICIAN